MSQYSENNFIKLLRDFCNQHNILSAATLSLCTEIKNAIRSELQKIYNKNNNAIVSEYLIRTLKQRSNPFEGRNWAKSYISFAIPIDIIPDLNFTMLEDQNCEKYLAAYSKKLDYHIFCNKILKEFFLLLNQNQNSNINYEICVDTKPVPEKILAKFAKLGKIGYNNCLICNQRSDFFIASAFTSIELPQITLNDNPIFECENCKMCLKNCPTGALAENKFFPQKCISYITIEKKGELSIEERKLIGSQIFGCDICTFSCPKSHKIPNPKINKDCLLALNEKEFREIFKKSPILYAGLKKLKRNASE
ncbi:MAG TPA: 4Fe-4S double cluster binding domain-containing protein [Victivallales bacterium]|nr:4Fe-4S double cluster binding domain-containing protein [Victivallales bacterium]